MGSSAKRTNFLGMFCVEFPLRSCMLSFVYVIKSFYIVQIIFIILELIKKYEFFISHADGCHSHVWKE